MYATVLQDVYLFQIPIWRIFVLEEAVQRMKK